MSDQGCHDAQAVEFQSPRAVVCLMQDQGHHDAQAHDAQAVAPPNPEMAAASMGYRAQAAASHRFEVDTLP